VDSITPGMVFQGRYEILSRLGEGGFGQVFKARQRVTNHEVAVKVLRALHTTAEHHVARFQREMELCAQLHHPNIVRLIDSGRVEPDLLYTVFEYIPGRTLADVLAAEGALPAWEAAHLMLQVLDALGCAHKKNVIHRDLKPQNIMVTDTGVRRNALVLDFGLGTLSQESKLELTPITQTREVLGTPAYAAPEQLRGEPVTERADLYSWGLIFLECLTGHRVVEGATLQQVLHKQIGVEPVAIPAWLEQHRLGRLLRKVTNKDAATRDISAASVLRELEACAAEGWPTTEEPQAAATTTTPSSLRDTLITRSEGERRQLTAVCCHLHLVRAEGDQTDEEDLDRLLWSLHTVCVEAARRHDGYVGSLLGERMLFYFGYPKAHEDDARRAARAALDLAAELERRGAELERANKGRLEFRAGVHTGLVISQEPRARSLGHLPALVGTTPNLASWLEQQAELGAVLVSEATSKVLRGHFAFESVEPRGADAQGAPVFRLLHEYKALYSSQAADSAVKPLYGRAQELELLQQRWWQAVAGTGQSVLLTGEPGIGKSRLVQELMRQARSSPHTLLECRCLPEGRNSALYPVVELLGRLLGISREWTPAQTVSALEALLSQYSFDLADAMPLFLGLLQVQGDAGRYPPLPISPELAKEQTLDAVVNLLFEMAAQQPLLLLVEDLHWADPTTLELLGQLLEELSTGRICLVLTARQEFTTPWPTGYHLQLSRLERRRVEEMVHGLTRGRTLPPEVIEQLVNRTDGVPLFVEELTQAVMSSLPARADTPSRTTLPAAVTIPATLRDSLMARLDSLGPAREVAQLASALGREFSYEVLKSIAQREEPELQRELKALVEADLVHRRRGVRNPTYLFKHALIRDMAYEAMLKPVRRQVHARIAAALEAHFPEIAGVRPDLLVLHHAAAEQKRQALDYAQKAALAALMRSAHHETIAHITEALGWLDAVEDPRERAQVELGLSSLLMPAMMDVHGWADERIKALAERSQELIDQLGDSPNVVPPLWGLVFFYYTRGQYELTLNMADRLMAMAEQSGSDGLKVMALYVRCGCFTAVGRLLEAREAGNRVMALYDVEKHQPLAMQFGIEPRALTKLMLGLAEWLLGNPEQAIADAQEGFTFAKESKHVGTLGISYLYALTLLQVRGEREQLITMADEGIELNKRYGLASHAEYCQMMRNWATGDAGPLRQGISFHIGRGMEMGTTYYKALLADLELAAGRHDSALETLESAIRWGRSSGELYMMAELLRLKAQCLRVRGAAGPAEACLREAVDIARQLSARMHELKAVSALCELLVEQGQATQARELLAPVVQGFSTALDVPDIARARALLARSAA
jgi:TOMM system kinase/cyclase fusion protein